MKDKLQFYINGKWVESKSNERIEIINPANEELIGHVTAGTRDDINQAVLAASQAFKTFQFTSREDRIEILNNIIATTDVFVEVCNVHVRFELTVRKRVMK